MGKFERIEVFPEDRERLVKLVRDRNTPQSETSVRITTLDLCFDPIEKRQPVACEPVLAFRQWTPK